MFAISRGGGRLFGINIGNTTEGLREFVDRVLRKIIWAQEAWGVRDISGPNVKINLENLNTRGSELAKQFVQCNDLRIRNVQHKS